MKNNHNIYITNHRKKEKEIVPFEFYSTHKNSVRTFLTEFLIDHQIKYAWEPACGLGNISKVLEEFGIKHISSDIVDRTPQLNNFIGGLDFLEQKDLIDGFDTIITNPPFKYAEEFVKKAAELNPEKYIIMYLKLTFLEGKKRYKLFQDFKPSKIYIHPSRQGCSPEGKEEFNNGGAVCYAWYVWETDDLVLINGKDKIKRDHTDIYWLPLNS